MRGKVGRAEHVYALICANAGITLYELRNLLGLKGSVDSYLTRLELNGYLIYEDEDGRLYPYKKIEPGLLTSLVIGEEIL